MANLAVAIATRGRPDFIRKALVSVINQSRLPQVVLVVGDDAEDLGTETTQGVRYKKALPVTFLLNHRARNVSGALNTALGHLLEIGWNPEGTYVAFLDDDDAWEVDYLRKSMEAAERESFDFVYAGVVRHERAEDPGFLLSIPASLTVSQFLATNPHVQGSNMIVRLSCLLRAGGFDENMPSTTDRDLCIRLLDLGDLRYGAVLEHLVHHWATEHPRLSTPGSSRKAEGLRAFLEKHGPRMTKEEQQQFLERAWTLFNWQPVTSSGQEAPPQPGMFPRPKSTGPIQLVVGFSATWLETARALLSDIARFSSEIGGIAKLVVCDNTAKPEVLREMLSALTEQGVPIRLASAGEIGRDARAGKFGSYYVPTERRIGIAYGRTALQHYMYREAEGFRDAVFWILDDDVRLDEVLYGEPPRRLTGSEFVDLLRTLKEDGCDIAVGNVYGDPPLPAASCVRTQLNDLVHNLRALCNDEYRSPPKEAAELTRRLCEAYPDYYYDMSIAHHGHLEVPFWIAMRDAVSARRELLENLLRRATAIAGGIGIFRPVKPRNAGAGWSQGQIPVRGGNTLVFDRECLKMYPNVAPRLGDVNCRRGDTVWCILNSHLGGLKVHRRKKRVHSIPVFVKHARQGSDPPSLSLRPILSDIFGGAFMRALDETLRERVQSLPLSALPLELPHLSEDQIEHAVARFEAHAAPRLILLEMNAWRIRGLTSTLRNLLREIEARGGENAAVFQRHSDSLAALLDALDRTFSREVVNQLVGTAKNYPRQDLEEFLRSLPEKWSSYAQHLLPVADSQDIAEAAAFLRDHLGISTPQLVGEGREGVVFTDGTYAYKYFHHGNAHFPPGQLDFLRETLGPERDWKHVVPLKRVVALKERVVFVHRYVPGAPYRGGHLSELLGLLRECRRAGVVLTNLAPSNLIVGSDGLRYVDLGISVEPYEERIFREMCKRAYLVYRWHFRSDLRQILQQALQDTTLPELFGFENFVAALDDRPVEEVLDPPLLELIHRLEAREVFDYGCGSGRMAAKVAKDGIPVVAYDLDESQFDPVHPIPGLTFLGPEGLQSLREEKRTFDCVLCNLVLCTIEDDAEFERVLADLRQLVAPDGHVIIGVCNPFALGTRESQTHVRGSDADKKRYRETFFYAESVKPDRDSRLEIHRPLSRYIRACRNAGLELEGIIETQGSDIDALCPSSDFLIVRLRPLRPSPTSSVSLLIKASAMEWRTIGVQVRHIVGQLEGPQRFLEKVVLTDDCLGPFARQYDEPNWEVFVRELEGLQRECVIDRYIVAPMDDAAIRATFRRWFGLDVADPRSENDQPTHTTLYGIEHCRGDYILQLDSDCLIGRLDRDHDYLGEMLDVFEEDPRAVTVSFPVANQSASPYTPSREGRKWRAEVRCCLLSKSRLLRLIPLPNKISEASRVVLPWHRSLDTAMCNGEGQSYRKGDPRTFFIHVPNDRKKDVNGWYNILKAVEDGRLIPDQLGKADLVGEVEDWLGRRTENLVFIVRGRNVPIPRLRRCVESLLRQHDESWGSVLIDAGSENGADEFLAEIVRRQLGGRMTLLRNLFPVTPVENLVFPVQRLCAREDSIIATLDVDDALIGTEVVDIVKAAYSQGADVTVGSMLRTDKESCYLVHFDRPRKHRGGNVWQHLRTFRKYLFDSIPEEHLKVDGTWIPFAEDWAFMLSIVEMSKHPIHITRPLYFYDPSPDKLLRPKEEREALIASIVAKPSLAG